MNGVQQNQIKFSTWAGALPLSIEHRGEAHKSVGEMISQVQVLLNYGLTRIILLTEICRNSIWHLHKLLL
jgi:hypothetical protein